MKIVFNSVAEFLELKGRLDSDWIEPAVRITKMFTRGSQVPISYVSVVAGYLRHQNGILLLTELKVPIGDYFEADEARRESVLANANELVDEITKACTVVGVETRAGFYKSTKEDE